MERNSQELNLQVGDKKIFGIRKYFVVWVQFVSDIGEKQVPSNTDW